MKSLASEVCRSETLERIRALSVDSPRRWGKMAVGQMVCHLDDGFLMAAGERPVGEVSSAWSRTGMRWLALYLPVPWPKGVRTLPEVDQLRDGTPPTEFATDVDRLERSFVSFVEAATADRCGRHPFFGALSSAEWLRLGYLHADHHMRQFSG